MEYNSLQSDIRLVKTSKEDAIKIIKQFERKWIYVKLIVNKVDNYSLQDYVVNYNKFKIAYVNEDSYSRLLFVYGIEDEDRLIISIDEIVQTEKSNTEDEVLLVLKNEKIMTHICIKSFVPNKERLIHDLLNMNQNLIITEGKTDWKHLKAAFKKFNSDGLYNDLEFKFLEYDGSLADSNDRLKNKKIGGADTLNTICQYNALFYNEKLRIFVFDSDKENINKLYKTEQSYQYLGNNVYVVILPLPKFRQNTPAISIENYYTDDEIKIKDKNDKRLYLSNEFNFNKDDEKTGNKIYSLKAKEDMPNLIIDDEVYINYRGLEIANKDELKNLIKEGKLKKAYTLSKNEFADNILNEVVPFNSFSKNNFKLFFGVIEEIFKIKAQTALDEELGLIFKKEIQKDVEIECYKEHQDLHLNIRFSAEIIKELRNNGLKTNTIYTKDNKIIIAQAISIEKEIVLSEINISIDILNFILKKADNSNNRVYLNTFNRYNDYVCSFELFQGDNGYIAFNHLLKQLKQYSIHSSK
ncbi:hypothetical protein M8E35_21385 [Desulfosporosinus nitroreducens]|nr:hypothetical protein [Desulfosporosinus nitroreducens]